MIIAIDGYEANNVSRVGIGRYSYELIQAIYALRTSDKNSGISFRIYLPDKPASDMPKQTQWWQYRIIHPKKFWTFIAFPLGLILDTPKPDVIFSPTHYAPRFIGIPSVISIMDISYLKYPQLFRRKDLYQLVHWTRHSARRAAKIFTISNASRGDIIKEYGVKPENVIVTYPGLYHSMDKKKDHSGQNGSIYTKYGISGHYILSVGTIQPRKNYERLIAAFAEFLKKNRQKFGNIQLVIAGKRGWLYESILEAPEKYNVGDKVKFLDFVDDADLPELYKHALCFALPSLYEGFGLPVAEAMTYGCPVVVSNVSSLPEIAGKAGIYVNPDSIHSIAEGLLTAVRQRNLMQGKKRIEVGRTHVKQFTWEKAAKDTLKILTEVAKT